VDRPARAVCAEFARILRFSRERASVVNAVVVSVYTFRVRILVNADASLVLEFGASRICSAIASCPRGTSNRFRPD